MFFKIKNPNFKSKRELVAENRELSALVAKLTAQTNKQSEIIKAVEEICDSCTDLINNYVGGADND